MSLKNFLKASCLAITLAIGAQPSTASSGPSPEELVSDFHVALLGTMKQASTTAVKQRFEMLQTAITEGFHLPLMIQVASSSYWRKASETQRDNLIAAFSRLSIATYAAQFDGYSGQSFETLGNKPGPQETILVNTQIVNPGSDNVALTYVTRKIKGNWRIIDVLLDTGISQLAQRLSEYRQVLKSGGVDGLVHMLNDKADALLTN